MISASKFVWSHYRFVTYLGNEVLTSVGVGERGRYVCLFRIKVSHDNVEVGLLGGVQGLGDVLVHFLYFMATMSMSVHTLG